MARLVAISDRVSLRHRSNLNPEHNSVSSSEAA